MSDLTVNDLRVLDQLGDGDPIVCDFHKTHLPEVIQAVLNTPGGREAMVEALRANPKPRCAACGQPAHRYSTADPEHDFDPQACINTLLGEIERLEAQLAREKG